MSVIVPLGIISNFHDGSSSRFLCATRTGRPGTLHAYDGFGGVISNAYDHLSRRVLKVTPTATHTYLYDDWNLVQETISTASGTTTNHYVWGKDLSGSLQGAGGVGGLLAVSINGAWYFPFYDNNGNITAYVDEQGAIVAEYTYDAFGFTIEATGSMADAFLHRFSTKYLDVETGLYYYGYRFYAPELMRWLNRDPIEEEGFRAAFSGALIGAPIEAAVEVLANISGQAFSGELPVGLFAHGDQNTYLFVLNRPVNLKDRLGLDITLETGNHAPWYQFLNNLVHQQVCVDLWDDKKACTEENKWDCCHAGKTCFSFGATGFQTPQFSTTWLGWRSWIVGEIMKGEIYEAEPVSGATINGTHTTTMQQDEKWLSYMYGRVDTQGGYSAAHHNCRKYSQWEFRDALLHW
ncbi:MAG: RHS repeat-associated core domain-containing protein [Kiritimatiellia bacterium]